MEPLQLQNGSATTETLQNGGLRKRLNGQKNGTMLNEVNILPDNEKNSNTERIFIARESPLSELFTNNLHFRIVYHIFIVIFIIMLLNNMVYDFFDKGELNFGQRLIIIGFGKIHIVAAVWILMKMQCFATLYLTEFWATVRLQSALTGVLLKVWDITWILIHAAGMLLLINYSTSAVYNFELPVASTAIVVMEMIRLIMKLHSFLRNCVPGVLRCKKVGNKDISSCLPTTSHFTYFLFAPTLLYRGSYPRTPCVRKRIVVNHFLEVVGAILLISFLCDKFMFGIWSTYGLQSKNAAHIAADIFTCCFPGILTFLSGFFLFLHGWNNAFAEMLRFADRQFYKEWWIKSQFGAYYRCWNGIIHDWLRSHVYNEVLPYCGRNMATFAVFIVSASVHELILMLMFRFFYPVMFIMFGVFGLSMVPLTQKFGKNYPSFGNICMWLSFVTGNGLLWSLYSMEYFARINCDTTNTTWWKPVSWGCPEITLRPDWKFVHPFSNRSISSN